MPRSYVDLHGCTILGVQSCHDLLKMQLLATVQCTVYADVDVVLWNSTFYILFNMSSFFPIYFSVYMPMSASLYHCHLSLHLFGSFSFDSSFLLKPLDFPYLFPISWILLSTLSSLTTWRMIHCFISDKQCDHSQLRNLLHFKLLPCKRG